MGIKTEPFRLKIVGEPVRWVSKTEVRCEMEETEITVKVVEDSKLSTIIYTYIYIYDLDVLNITDRLSFSLISLTVSPEEMKMQIN